MVVVSKEGTNSLVFVKSLHEFNIPIEEGQESSISEQLTGDLCRLFYVLGVFIKIVPYSIH